MTLKKPILFVLMLMTISSVARADEEIARQVERLSSAVMMSPYGNIARTQAILTLVCDQEGLSKALEKHKQEELLNLMLQKKVVWANGDSPELMHTLTTALVASYAMGLQRLANGATPTGIALKLGVCQSAAKDANAILENRAVTQP